MKIKSIKLTDFKRFTDLTIEGLPETAKLVVMIGPNGCGKSSVFDALHIYKQNRGGQLGDPYYTKHDSSEKYVEVPVVEFHTSDLRAEGELAKWVHVRSTYRSHLARKFEFGVPFPSITAERRFERMIEDDQAFASNYSRLMNQLMERSSASDQREKNVGDLQDEIFGDLRSAIERLFNDPELILDSLGNPAEEKIFKFNKGTSHGFSYQNLSSGEKASLDLLLDLIVAKVAFNDTVFCIDEPEAHIHTKLQGSLLEELYNLTPDNSQLWIATHSVGMVRKAQDLRHENPDSIVFLDFGKNKAGEDRDFDGQETIEPAEPNPNFWAQTYEIALGDLAELIAPQRIVLCESKAQDPAKGFDAACYNQIFGSRYPDTRFISIGNDKEVERADTHLIPVIQAIATGTEILRIRDRDDAICQEIEEDAKKGIRTPSRRNIEGYLLDDEVLTELCNREGKPDKIQDLLDAKQTALQRSIAEGKDHDDLKPTAQGIHVAAQNALKPSKMGNKSRNFMKDILAPLIQPGMKVYKELHKDVFGE